MAWLRDGDGAGQLRRRLESAVAGQRSLRWTAVKGGRLERAGPFQQLRLSERAVGALLETVCYHKMMSQSVAGANDVNQRPLPERCQSAARTLPHALARPRLLLLRGSLSHQHQHQTLRSTVRLAALKSAMPRCGSQQPVSRSGFQCAPPTTCSDCLPNPSRCAHATQLHAALGLQLTAAGAACSRAPDSCSRAPRLGLASLQTPFERTNAGSVAVPMPPVRQMSGCSCSSFRHARAEL